MKRDVVVIGSGPAGLAAALKAKEEGIEKVLVVERDIVPGGILNQCIHDGFGLFRYKKNLTGPEYAHILIKECENAGVEFALDTMAFAKPGEQRIELFSDKGRSEVDFGVLLLAMGCRERTRQLIGIPGMRPAGVFTAGSAQNYTNLRNLRIGNRVVVLGSGDIGLIMARRLHLEGLDVAGVYERLPAPCGLQRNIEQCLNDYGVPLHLSKTVSYIHGKDRVEAVTVVDVDKDLQPVKGTEERIECDTLLLSVGLIPENEVSKGLGVEIKRENHSPVCRNTLQTGFDNILACGNVLEIHDLADIASEQGELAGINAARILRKKKLLTTNEYMGDYEPLKASCVSCPGVTCILCPKGCFIHESADGGIEGNLCPKGEQFWEDEKVSPKRYVTTNVRISGGRFFKMLSVRTDRPVPKSRISEVMKLSRGISLNAPFGFGEIVVDNILETGANLVSTREVEKD